MEIHEILGILGVPFATAAYILYCITTLKSADHRPPRVTWAIFCAINWISAFSNRELGASASNYVPFVFAVGATTVMTVSLFHGSGGKGLIDVLCAIGALISGYFWLSSNPETSIFLSIVVGIIGSIPLVTKLIKAENKESSLCWALWTLSAIMSTLAVKEPTIEQYAYPGWLTFQCAIVFLLSIRASAILESSSS